MKRKEEEELELDRLKAAAEAEFNKKVLEQSLVEAAKEKERQRTVASITNDVSQNIDQVERTIKSDASLPSGVKDELAIAATNDRAVQESAKRNMGTMDAQQSNGSIKNQFLDALTFFGPQIIGGLFGAAEGDAGMLAGAEIGGKLRDQYLDYNFKKQDRELQQQRQLAQATGTNQIISQPFRMKDGSGWAFPRKVIDMSTGQPVVKFYKEDGVEVSSAMVEEPQDTRTKAYLPFKEKQLSQGQIKLAETSAQNFVKTKTVAQQQEKLQNIIELEDLVNSNTNITGLIDFKMAKGIAGEVGNLAESERKAAAQIVGYRGALANLEEWMTSNLSSVRREEILKLVNYIKPRVKQRLVDKAKKYADKRADKYGMSKKQYTQFLLDSTGFDLIEEPEPQVSDRRQQMIDRIKAIKSRRGN